MFSENNKLSVNGIKKLILTEETGLVFLLSMYFAEKLDILTGFVLISAIFTCSCLYLNLVFHIYEKGTKEGVLKKYIRIKSAAKAFLLLGFGALMLIKYVREFLLPNTNVIFSAAVIFLFAFFISRKEIEIRGRFCELFYIFVFIPVIISMIYELFCIDYHNFFTIISNVLLPQYDLNFRNFLKLFLIGLFSFLVLCPWGYLFLKEPFFHEAKEAKKSLLKVSFLLYLLCLLQFLFSKLTYNINPVLSIVISLMMYIATQLHYGMPKQKFFPYIYTGCSFLFLIVLLMLPSFLETTHLYTYLSEMNFDKLYVSGSHIIDARELESRSFVISMIISEDESGILFTCELADYSEGTESISSEYITVSHLESYPLSGGKYLDFSHIRAIVLDISEESFSSDDLDSLADEYRIPGNTLIFREKDFPNTYAHLISQLDKLSLGEVLDTLAENQNIKKELMLRNQPKNNSTR